MGREGKMEERWWKGKKIRAWESPLAGWLPASG